MRSIGWVKHRTYWWVKHRTVAVTHELLQEIRFFKEFICLRNISLPEPEQINCPNCPNSNASEDRGYNKQEVYNSLCHMISVLLRHEQEQTLAEFYSPSHKEGLFCLISNPVHNVNNYLEKFHCAKLTNLATTLINFYHWIHINTRKIIRWRYFLIIALVLLASVMYSRSLRSHPASSSRLMSGLVREIESVDSDAAISARAETFRSIPKDPRNLVSRHLWHINCEWIFFARYVFWHLSKLKLGKGFPLLLNSQCNRRCDLWVLPLEWTSLRP